MCGIVGIINKYGHGFTNVQCSMAHSLIMADAVRGMDSTGLFQVSKDFDLRWIKEASNAGVLATNPEYEEFMKQLYRDGLMVIGHNRKATRGKISDDNAHPFIEGNTILVHNGFISNLFEIDKEKKFESDVDSQSLCKFIEAEGYQKAFTSITGAFAVAFYDINKNRLTLTRNDQRPLFFVETETSWMIGSERSMIEWAILREGQKAKESFFVGPENFVHFDLDKPTKWKAESYKRISFLPITRASASNDNNDDNQIRINHPKPGGDLEEINKDFTEPQEWNPPFLFNNPNQEYFKSINTIDFIYEKTILFNQPTQDADGLITGYWLYNKKVKVHVLFNIDELDNLHIGDYCTGEIKTINPVQGKEYSFVIMLKSFQAGWRTKTKNGIMLSDEFIQYRLPANCSKCKAELDYKDLNQMTVKLKINKTDHRIICPKCSESFPVIVSTHV